jgi:hypothetical protein
MATRLKTRPTYEEDFYAWARAQARHLRDQARPGKYAPLDWQLLAEATSDSSGKAADR